MSSDCGQYSGVNNCRFSNSAGAYLSLEDAYAEPDYPSPALALFDYCPRGKNPSEMNSLSSFDNQSFGAFNQPPKMEVVSSKPMAK